MGAFGMKIPTEYSGLGFDQLDAQVMELLGVTDGNLTALLSAHSHWRPALKLFGSEELKKKYLPRCASGEISAFALTEPEVGSDPARLTTSVKLSKTEKSSSSTAPSCGLTWHPGQNVGCHGQA